MKVALVSFPVALGLALSFVLACAGAPAEGEGEGSFAEGEGASSEGEGSSSEGEGAASEGEGSASEGEGAASEGEGAVGEGEGEGEGAAAVCGDGVVSGAEQCDDGRNDAGDGCGATCRIEVGFFCDNDASGPSVCGPFVVDLGDLDVGGVIQLDDVTPNPQVRHYLVHVVSRLVLTETNVVADGAASVSLLSATGSVLVADASQGFSLLLDPQIVVVSVVAPAGTATQVAPTQLVLTGNREPVCPDGLVEIGEECDDANAVSGDGCSSCTVDPFFGCTGSPSQCAPLWTELGDIDTGGRIDFSDVNALAGTRFYHLNALAPLHLDVDIAPANVLEVSYFHLDGTPIAFSGANVAVDAGDVIIQVASAGVPSLDLHIKDEVCGDGALDFFEHCDDGTIAGGDGCGACRVELFFSCTQTSPSVCTGPSDIGALSIGALITADQASVHDDAGRLNDAGAAPFDAYYAFTLSAPAVVHVDIGASSGAGAGTAGFTIVTPQNGSFIHVVATSADIGLPAGSYVLGVDAIGDLVNLHAVLSASPLEGDLGALAANATVTAVRGTTQPGALVVYGVTFTEAVTVDASAALTSGQASLSLVDAQGNADGDPFASAAPNVHAVKSAGFYLLELRAGSFASVSGFSVTLTTTP